jgi:hypothetical protein
MTDNTTIALARLRAADPATAAPDPHDAYARAMLDRILTIHSVPSPARGRRRLVGALSAAAILAAGAIAVAVQAQTASAYTVDERSDGSVTVTLHVSQLKHTTALNAELARMGVPTVIMALVPAGRCNTAPAIDRAFRLPADPTPDQRAAQLARMPVRYQPRDDEVVILIQPSKIPAGDTLVIGYTSHDHTSMVIPVVVTSVPPCLAAERPR